MAEINSYKIIPPKQKYMTIPEMYKTYASRGIVIYSSKVVDSVLEGGVVIAVQDTENSDPTSIKQYMNKLRKNHPDKKPIFYLRIEPGTGHQRYNLTYDNGGGERTLMPKLEVRKTEAQEKIETVPEDFIAQALALSLNKD